LNSNDIFRAFIKKMNKKLTLHSLLRWYLYYYKENRKGGGWWHVFVLSLCSGLVLHPLKMGKAIVCKDFHHVQLIGSWTREWSSANWGNGNTVSSVCAAPFSNICSIQADINSRKLRLRCGCQFPWCSHAQLLASSCVILVFVIGASSDPWVADPLKERNKKKGTKTIVCLKRSQASKTYNYVWLFGMTNESDIPMLTSLIVSWP
jgi:hypothetical protein